MQTRHVIGGRHVGICVYLISGGWAGHLYLHMCTCVLDMWGAGWEQFDNMVDNMTWFDLDVGLNTKNLLAISLNRIGMGASPHYVYMCLIIFSCSIAPSQNILMTKWSTPIIW